MKALAKHIIGIVTDAAIIAACLGAGVGITLRWVL